MTLLDIGNKVKELFNSISNKPLIQQAWEERSNMPLPGRIAGTLGQIGALGPLPQAARFVTQQFPQTTLPISQFASKLSPLPVEKFTLGQKLPQPTTKWEKAAAFTGGMTGGAILGGPKFALSMPLVTGGFGTISQLGQNIFNRQPLTQNLPLATLQGAYEGGSTASTFAAAQGLGSKIFAPIINKIDPYKQKAITPYLNILTSKNISNESKKQALLLLARTIGRKYTTSIVEFGGGLGLFGSMQEANNLKEFANNIKESALSGVALGAGMTTLGLGGEIGGYGIKKGIEAYKGLTPEQRQAGFIKIKSSGIKPEVKPIPKELEPFAVEARKLKTAKEFEKKYPKIFDDLQEKGIITDSWKIGRAMI